MDERSGEIGWTSIASSLEEIEAILTKAGDPGAAWAARLREEIRTGPTDSTLDDLTGGGTWNHMGSFFDRSLPDRSLDLDFQRAQIRLADALHAEGVATADVLQWAQVLRTWDANRA